ncbi:hypothetical protein OG618_37340 (plasmid) [Kitasatospora sp. NBC_01246]|uniref:hypothetical protein n=1 Tax=Kitasatospora sp. NBC_01246 TaxID=2903570 RepID=UPI002E318F34|nr:hypothetical protein [Kitasatospora sp. NBC_01246]
MTNPPTDPREHYAIRLDDGRHLYHLPGLFSWGGPFHDVTEVRIFGDGQPLTRLPDTAWWSAPHAVAEITASWRPRAKVTAHVLDDPDMASAALPLSVPADDWDSFVDRSHHGSPDFYHAVYEQQDTRTGPVPGGPWRVLGGEAPPTSADRRWVASLPHSLTNHPEYRWWFPGRLAGLRDAVRDYANTLPFVRFASIPRTPNGQDQNEGLDVAIGLPFQQPVTELSDYGQDGRKLRRPRTVPISARFALSLPVPSSVYGDTYAAALTEWNRLYAEFTALLDHQAQTGVKACNACAGHGYLPVDPTHASAPVPRRSHL